MAVDVNDGSPNVVTALAVDVESAQTAISRMASQLKIASVPFTRASGYSGFLPYA